MISHVLNCGSAQIDRGAVGVHCIAYMLRGTLLTVVKSDVKGKTSVYFFTCKIEI